MRRGKRRRRESEFRETINGYLVELNDGANLYNCLIWLFSDGTWRLLQTKTTYETLNRTTRKY